jgi:predicted chitinase
MNITADFLKTIAPAAKPEIVNGVVRNQHLLALYGIKSVDEICYFFGQFALETSGITALEENLFYTTPQRLMAVWPSRFKTVAAAQPYVRNPQKLANLTYGGRLGNVLPNDGWLYRGSGGFHTTGKFNYQLVEKATGKPVVGNPDMLRDPNQSMFLESACVYWRDNKLSKHVGNIKAMTKAVQGGTGGLADRTLYTNRALKAAKHLGTVGAPPTPVQGYLRRGSTGPEVETLQRRLIALGIASVGNPDGVYGGATEDAVRLFQRSAGLVPADGVVGPATRAALARSAVLVGDRQPAEPERRLPGDSGMDRFVIWLAGVFRQIFGG